ncbi:MAG TPA: hypothetical protein VEQ16_05200, partial [Acidocella sp.]|nr:hypothetical protein [Acidocella sp.]
IATLAGCVLPPPAPPPNSHPQVSITNGGSLITINNTMIAAAGQTVRIGFLHDHQNPDCSLAVGQHPILDVTTQPAHGSLSQQQTEDFPTYPANNPLSKCNQARIAGTLFTYTPQTGYSGTDQFSYQIFTSTGQELVTNTAVTVAP